jgi:hypothetical protein
MTRNILWLPVAFALAATSPGYLSLEAQGVVDALDHYRTGFPLEGRHASLRCEACHRDADFRPVPRLCAQCHNGVLAEGRTFRHIPSSAPCDQCHSALDWRTSRFDHTNVAAGCVRCHNNFLAPGKTLKHPATTETCETCHNTIHWNQILPTARTGLP